MVDALGKELQIDDVVAHVSNSSGSIWVTEVTVIGFTPTRVRCEKRYSNTDKVYTQSYAPNRLIKLGHKES